MNNSAKFRLQGASARLFADRFKRALELRPYWKPVFYLKYYEEMTVAEIAVALDLSDTVVEAIARDVSKIAETLKTDCAEV